MRKNVKHFITRQITECFEIRNSHTNQLHCASRKMLFVVSNCVICRLNERLLHKGTAAKDNNINISNNITL